jgi:hypothetical protein
MLRCPTLFPPGVARWPVGAEVESELKAAFAKSLMLRCQVTNAEGQVTNAEVSSH